MSSTKPGPGPSGRRHGDRLNKGLRHGNADPYREREKPPEPSVCPDCGAVFRAGRWQWAGGPVTAAPVTCPACRRIRDDYPAGILRIRGEFARAHRDEIERLLRNVETREGEQHALERIMKIEARDDEVEVRTTGHHLARALGRALESAFQGELALDYEEELLRASWSR